MVFTHSGGTRHLFSYAFLCLPYTFQASNILFRFPVERLSNNLQVPLIVPNDAGMANGRRYFGPVTIEKLRVRLLDDKGNPADFHCADISFSLITTVFDSLLICAIKNSVMVFCSELLSLLLVVSFSAVAFSFWSLFSLIFFIFLCF